MCVCVCVCIRIREKEVMNLRRRNGRKDLRKERKGEVAKVLSGLKKKIKRTLKARTEEAQFYPCCNP